MDWVSFPLRDYCASITGLDWNEECAYWRMLRTYYRSETPLPHNPKTLMRLLGATTEEQQRAVISILEKFFVLQYGQWFHCGVEQTLEKRRESQSRRRGFASPAEHESPTEPTNIVPINKGYAHTYPQSYAHTDASLNTRAHTYACVPGREHCVNTDYQTVLAAHPLDKSSPEYLTAALKGNANPFLHHAQAICQAAVRLGIANVPHPNTRALAILTGRGLTAPIAQPILESVQQRGRDWTTARAELLALTRPPWQPPRQGHQTAPGCTIDRQDVSAHVDEAEKGWNGNHAAELEENHNARKM